MLPTPEVHTLTQIGVDAACDVSSGEEAGAHE